MSKDVYAHLPAWEVDQITSLLKGASHDYNLAEYQVET